MDKFYLLLVKESLNNEDVAGLARDNVKDCHEIEQAFKTRWVAMQDLRLQCFYVCFQFIERFIHFLSISTLLPSQHFPPYYPFE